MKLLLILIFGSNLFTGSLQPVNPYQETPIDYVLNYGDSILVDIWGVSQDQFAQVINPQGQITIKGCGPISVKGKTIPEATKIIQKGIAVHYAGVNVGLSLLKPRMISVNIQGDVNSPGEHLIHGYSNLLRALQESGGITEVGSYRQVMLESNGQPVRTIDLYEYLQGQLDMNTIGMKNGDVIRVVPATSLVTIDGLIKRPATYELLANESVQDLITYADGITEDDIEIRVHHRSAEAQQTEIIPRENTVNYIPRDGDIISIVKVADKPDEVVIVLGNVANKGKYRIGKNVNTLKELLQIASPQIGEKPNVVVVYRDTNLVQIGNKDIPLRGCEKVYVIANQIEVRGAVFSAASFDYNSNFSIADYIRMAGGYTKKAAKKNTYVVETDGQHVSDDVNMRLVPGSIIIVPEK